MQKVSALPALQAQIPQLSRMLSAHNSEKASSGKVPTKGSVTPTAPYEPLASNCSEPHRETLPSTTVRDVINEPCPTRVWPEAWCSDRKLFSIERHLDEFEARCRHEQLKYARFMANRHVLAQQVHPYEYSALASQVSTRLIFYDPNFDFQRREPLNFAPHDRQ